MDSISVKLFLLFPESNPTNQWMLSNDNLLDDEKKLLNFICKFEKSLHLIKIENYSGYYDSSNIKNFLANFEILNDYYPKSMLFKIRTILEDWFNWRDNQLQSDKKEYILFNQKINDNSFCEIAERKVRNPQNKYLLFNYYSCNIKDNLIHIKVEKNEIAISLVNKNNLFDWFCENRVPARVFHLNPKHGENGQGYFPNASPLMCNKEEAQILLNKAIGKEIKELFQFDSNHNMYLVFRYENEPNNRYHGYHIDKDSTEIPKIIKDRLKL